MTAPLPEPPIRRLPRSRAPLGPDVAVAFLVFLVEGRLLFVTALSWGMAGWAADGPRAEVDAASHTGISRLEDGDLLAAAPVVAGIVAVARAPWTAGSQLVIAAAFLVMLSMSQPSDDQAYRLLPRPTPTVLHPPCHSADATCG